MTSRWMPLSASILLHILSLALGLKPGIVPAPILRSEPHKHQVDHHHEPVAIDSQGVISVVHEPLSAKRHPVREAPEKAKPLRRRGILKPPTSLEEKVFHRPQTEARSQRQGTSVRQQSGKKHHRKRQHMNRHQRKSASTWTFRGPKPVSLLTDPRYTDQQKEVEFERLLEKLHLEFFMKHEMGHSRVAHARTEFYRTLDEYQQLTGREHPDNFHYEELPEIEGSELEIQEDLDDEDDTDDDTSNVVLVPSDLPTCMTACNSVANVCWTDASTWTGDQACNCYKGWLACSINLCDQTERDTNGWFIALDTCESEACAWPKTSLYDHLKLKSLMNRPANTTANEGIQTSTGTAFLDLSDQGAGLSFVPLVATPTGGLAEIDIDVDDDGSESAVRRRKTPDGATNKPTGCSVSNPEMLGDGNCDGGGYNTAACNYDGGDCCDEECRPGKHRCGLSGYSCKGERNAARVAKNFKCSEKNLPQFKEFFDTLRDRLTLGDAMQSDKCTQLNKEEHQQVSQAYNVGVELSWAENVQSAAARMGGPSLIIDCDLWDNEIGSDWFGTLITHELGHAAGYGHPDFKEKGMVFQSKCESLGSEYCSDHCMEWTSACTNHLVFGSEGCGFARTGCQTTCVKDDYCMSLPERATECFGYMKVHSRGETLTELISASVATATATLKEKPHLIVPLLLVLLCPFLSCGFAFHSHQKKKAEKAAAEGKGKQKATFLKGGGGGGKGKKGQLPQGEKGKTGKPGEGQTPKNYDWSGQAPPQQEAPPPAQ